MASSLQRTVVAVAVLAACLVAVPARQLKQQAGGGGNYFVECATGVEGAHPCTSDLNPCGFPSSCQCPEGYQYDQRLGPVAGCLKTGVFAGRTFEPLMLDDSTVNSMECALPIGGDDGINAACSRDVTACGYASVCACPEGYDYSREAKMCLKEL
mmetsp:Transcript_37772/g.106747  ORF Transcript_37772/g.106747 Transcript_37772/m.106747 type:complete len:155 (-) Transcript_37772:358-822(-)|eukprot:CAMPEP_0117675878 /NCGR_PEP_ID=MMETSP0804-20121206/15851_1 /TAXON_ID=1074897 /ORGANISM="Tetraselmis astigmatica, Strain CCMP880" /LENGTH=154 /DNA_ID=CAMNT_0005484933 /DNA_START=295 /DNA_END=759 /DNA_ORIENTATION=-